MIKKIAEGYAQIWGAASQDGVLRTTQSGKEIGSISVSVGKVGRDGAAMYVNVVAWNNENDKLGSYIAGHRKGDMVTAVGKFQARDSDDGTKTYYDVTVGYDGFVAITRANGEQGVTKSAAKADGFPGFDGEDDDFGELPF